MQKKGVFKIRPMDMVHDYKCLCWKTALQKIITVKIMLSAGVYAPSYNLELYTSYNLGNDKHTQALPLQYYNSCGIYTG